MMEFKIITVKIFKQSSPISAALQKFNCSPSKLLKKMNSRSASNGFLWRVLTSTRHGSHAVQTSNFLSHSTTKPYGDQNLPTSFIKTETLDFPRLLGVRSPDIMLMVKLENYDIAETPHIKFLEDKTNSSTSYLVSICCLIRNAFKNFSLWDLASFVSSAKKFKLANPPAEATSVTIIRDNETDPYTMEETVNQIINRSMRPVDTLNSPVVLFKKTSRADCRDKGGKQSDTGNAKECEAGDTSNSDKNKTPERKDGTKSDSGHESAEDPSPSKCEPGFCQFPNEKFTLRCPDTQPPANCSNCGAFSPGKSTASGESACSREPSCSSPSSGCQSPGSGSLSPERIVSGSSSGECPNRCSPPGTPASSYSGSPRSSSTHGSCRSCLTPGSSAASARSRSSARSSNSNRSNASSVRSLEEIPNFPEEGGWASLPDDIDAGLEEEMCERNRPRDDYWDRWRRPVQSQSRNPPPQANYYPRLYYEEVTYEPSPEPSAPRQKSPPFRVYEDPEGYEPASSIHRSRTSRGMPSPISVEGSARVNPMRSYNSPPLHGPDSSNRAVRVRRRVEYLPLDNPPRRTSTPTTAPQNLPPGRVRRNLLHDLSDSESPVTSSLHPPFEISPEPFIPRTRRRSEVLVFSDDEEAGPSCRSPTPGDTSWQRRSPLVFSDDEEAGPTCRSPTPGTTSWRRRSPLVFSEDEEAGPSCRSPTPGSGRRLVFSPEPTTTLSRQRRSPLVFSEDEDEDAGQVMLVRETVTTCDENNTCVEEQRETTVSRREFTNNGCHPVGTPVVKTEVVKTIPGDGNGCSPSGSG
nr:PREDICTED: serine/arginine repetitive matrix protein 1-like isoform X2 [Bemisia tabaci]